ncbi:MAG: hypothetical protein P8R42_17050 [Candidatus Binatia bacterium]|nr:hypothetical protein [Candidatus Binatia bacterium]
MSKEITRLIPSGRGRDLAKLDEVMERIRPEFVFVDPQQAPFYHRDNQETGESRLALAILEDALRCAVRHADSSLEIQRLEAAEALEWIQSDDDNYWLAFEPICQRFELDPGWIRQKIGRQLDTATRATDAHAA